MDDRFQSADGTCIRKGNMCDSDWEKNGSAHCSDGSDEAEDLCKDNCGGIMKDRFQCADGTCVPKWTRCDRYPHCSDGSDEADCSG